MSPTALPTIVDRPLVQVDGAPISETLMANLAETRVELVRNGVAQATLRFYDAKFELFDSSLNIGSAISISFPPAGSPQATTVFSGEIIAFAAEQGPNDLHEFVLTAFDRGHRLSRAVTPAAWNQVSYADVVAGIAQRHGLRSRTSGIDAIKFEHLLQTTDDAAFLSEVCARTGTTWRVSDGTLVVGSEGSETATATWGIDLRRFTTRVGGTGPIDGVRVRGWDVQRKRSIVGTAGPVSSHLSDAGATTTARSRAYSFDSATRTVSNRITDSQDEAELIATALRERMDSTVTQARGEVIGNPALAPGMALTVEGVGTRFGGTYVLTSVEHVHTPRAYVTRFHAGTRSSSTLVDLLAGAPRAHGAMIGIVTNNDDPEGMARVKVKLPLISDDLETDWARVVTIGGGPSTGFQVTPAVNDEVLVIFDGGDTRRPIVVGGLWNGTDAPPKPTSATTASGATKIWHLQTKAGHQLTFDERDSGSEHVTILLKDGKTKLRLGVDKIELWGDSQTVHVKTGQSNITMDQSNVKVEAPNISLKAQQTVKIEGLSVEIAGQTAAKLSGAKVDVQANATANIQGGASVAIAGAMVKIN